MVGGSEEGGLLSRFVGGRVRVRFRGLGSFPLSAPHLSVMRHYINSITTRQAKTTLDCRINGDARL